MFSWGIQNFKDNHAVWNLQKSLSGACLLNKSIIRFCEREATYQNPNIRLLLLYALKMIETVYATSMVYCNSSKAVIENGVCISSECLV